MVMVSVPISITALSIAFSVPQHYLSLAPAIHHPKANFSLSYTLAVAALMPLSLDASAANNRCASGVCAALPELVLI